MLSQHNVRLAILCLTVLGVVALLGCVGLAVIGSHDPSGLCTIAGTALGALAALIMPPRPPHRPNGTEPGPAGDRPGLEGPP